MPKKKPGRKPTGKRKYSKAASEEVHKELRALKKGKAHSGKAHKTVKSRKQAIAIGLSKARKKGMKAPKKAVSSSSSTKSASSRQSSSKKS